MADMIDTIREAGLKVGAELDEAGRWDAVLHRDAAYDGSFVYAVRSTGVFCRPSCPSRKPRREQVVFFGSGEAAKGAGFRACLRCKPGENAAAGPQLELVRQVCGLLEAGLERGEAPGLESLGREVGASPFYLQRVFKAAMGVTPRQYAEAMRVTRLKAHLKEGDTVTEALYSSGYNSGSRLYEKAGMHLGMSPGVYRRGAERVLINYTVVPFDLGYLLVAATEKGICAVRMGSTEAELGELLRKEYPAAELHRADEQLAGWVEAIIAGIGGGEGSERLPLDVRATAFQLRVWQALRAIPPGSTRSYSGVATSIGQPGAARAVAKACASNPVALIVPCHRVVREDGSMGGYRWGVERKQALLAREATLHEEGIEEGASTAS